MTDTSNGETRPNFRSVELTMLGYRVCARVPKRESLNSIGQFYATKHECRILEDYLVEYLRRPDPKPHVYQLDAHPLMTITEITPTNVTSLWGNARIRGRVVIPFFNLLPKKRGLISSN